MAKKTNKLVTPFSLVPEEMCRAHPEAAYYPGPSEQITPIRAAFWHLQQEGQLKWKVRVIEGTKHPAALLADWTPDILVTHWHGECSSGDKRSLPGDIARRLRNSRGDFRGSERPLLVAQISAGDPLFEHEPDEGTRLQKLYDMVIQRPRTFENFPKNIATGIYNAAHHDAPLAFDIDFRVLS
jgi:hypothetical protein